MSTATHDIRRTLSLEHPWIDTAASVDGWFNYLEPGSPTPRVYQPTPENPEIRREGSYAPYLKTVANGRVSARNYNLDIEGFELHQQRTAVSNFLDSNEVESIYYPEAEALIKSSTGASAVHFFDHTVRLEDVAQRAASGVRAPVQSVHNDYTEKSGPQRVWDLLPEADARHWLEHRFAIINVWRSIGAPVITQPLALIDARSTRRADFVPTDLVYPDRTGEIYQIEYNPAHRWTYFPNMTREEALLLKVFDSADDGRAKMTGHSAFQNPDAPADAPARESIELRALVSFAPRRH